MGRWIDANKLIKFINSKFVVSWKHDYDGGFKDACVEILNAIEDTPSIDIVRCKECKKAHLTYDGDCKYCEEWKDEDGFLIEVYHDKNFFCGYGERNSSEKPNNSTAEDCSDVGKE